MKTTILIAMAFIAIVLISSMVSASGIAVTGNPTSVTDSTGTDMSGTAVVETSTKATDRPINSESFETGFGSWTTDHYLQCEVENTCDPLEWNITRSMEHAYHEKYSLKAYINGNNDDGTIWAERTVNTSPNSTINVEISFYLWSLQYSEANTWPVLAYAGLNDPENELDFEIIGQTDQVEGWHKYTYRTTVKTDSKGIIWVGFGFGATWEVSRTYYLDLVGVGVAEKESVISPGLQSVLDQANSTTKIPVIMMVQKDYVNRLIETVRSYNEKVSNIKELTLIDAISFEAFPSVIIELSNLDYVTNIDRDYPTTIAKTAAGTSYPSNIGITEVGTTTGSTEGRGIAETGTIGAPTGPFVLNGTFVHVIPGEGCTGDRCPLSEARTTPSHKGTLQTPSVSAEYSGELSVSNSKLVMKTSAGSKQINILPSDAVKVSETPILESAKVELKEKSGSPTYSVTGIRKAKLLFIIPVSMEVRTDVNAETGSVISISKPWWNFLAW